MDNNNYETSICYKIYELMAGGLIKEPTIMTYGHGECVFESSGYDSLEAAKNAIQEAEGYAGEYLIFTVADKSCKN